MVVGDVAEDGIIVHQLKAELFEGGLNIVKIVIDKTRSRSPHCNMMWFVRSILALAPIPRKVALV